MRDGWLATTVGDIAEVVGGSTPSTKDPTLWGGGVPWITPSEVTANEGKVIQRTERTLSAAGLAAIRGRLLPAGTVLLTSRATVGAVALAGMPLAVNQGFAALVPGPAVIPEWLMYWCQHNKAEFVARAGGSTFPEISKPKVRAVPVLLPPLAEQRRIVDLVSMVDAVAMASTAVAAQARTALVALLEESVAGPGEGEPIGALLQHGIGGVWGQEPGRGDVNVTVYRSTEFGEWTDLSHTTVATRSISATQLRSRSLVSGDILIEKSGGTPTRPVGRVVWVGLADPLSICSNFVHLIRPDPSKVWPRYLLWALWSWHRRGVLYQFQTASTNIRNLKTKDYFAQRLSCPPLVTQQRIATMADELKDLGHQGERVGQAAVGLRRALLRALLNGGGQLPDSYDRFLETVS